MDPDRFPTPSALGARVIVIGGLPGSGKTTVGALLARTIGAALLDQDTVTNPLIAEIAALTGAGDDLDHPSLRGAVRDARYACLRDTAAEISSLGCPVVVVAPFTAEMIDPVAWQQFSSDFHSSLLVAITIDPAESLRRRLSRGHVRDQKLGGSAPAVGGFPVGGHVDLVLDGALPPEDLVAEIGSAADFPTR